MATGDRSDFNNQIRPFYEAVPNGINVHPAAVRVTALSPRRFDERPSQMNQNAVPTLVELRAVARELRLHLRTQVRHLKLIGGLQSVAIEPRHQLQQTHRIADEAMQFVDEFFELVELYPDNKRTRHDIVHVRGEARSIQIDLERFHEALQQANQSLLGQLNSPTRTSTGEIDAETMIGLWDFIMNCLQVGTDYASARKQRPELKRVRTKRKHQRRK